MYKKLYAKFYLAGEYVFYKVDDNSEMKNYIFEGLEKISE